MASSPVLGNTRLAELRRNGILTDEVARNIAEAGAKVRLPDYRLDWAALLDTYQREGDLSREDLSDISEFTETARAVRKALEKQFKEEEEAGKRDLKKLALLDAYLAPVNRVRDAYLEATSRAAVGALAGASFGPLSTVAAYLAWNPAPPKRVEVLVENLRGLDSGKSPLLTHGNHIRPVHQENLWKTKLQMLQEATEMAKAGHPPEIDVQYFEMTSSSFVGRLAEAARAGCRVRINVDPSRPRKDSTVDVSVDDSPRKLRALLQLLDVPDADVAVSIYPVREELGSLQQLMHRKLLRVGEKVLFGGMNANEGSGENFDNAYLIEGPAARQLVEGFQEDVKVSIGATPAQIYGEKLMTDFEEGSVSLTPHGLATTLDTLTGPSPAGTRIPSKPTLDSLEELAARAKVRLGDLMDRETLEAQISKGSTKPIELKSRGKKLLLELIERTFERVGDAKNQERLKEIDLPAGLPCGSTQVAVAGHSEERESVILQAIATAEKFVYVPTFVITKAVARALAARRDELRSQGKELDVRVVADAGVYQYGGSPNEDGYLALEDAGIPVRFSLLTRAQMEHDRKIHAKQILTDKMELVGSTNLSNKGVRDNWELSGLVYFDEHDADSMAARQEGVERFERLWQYESISLDTHAAARLQDIETLGEYESRKKSIRSFLNMIGNYELQSAKWVEQQMVEFDLNPRALDLQKEGMAYGYARLTACQEKMGLPTFYEGLRQLPTYQRLQAFSRGEPVPAE